MSVQGGPGGQGFHAISPYKGGCPSGGSLGGL